MLQRNRLLGSLRECCKCDSEPTMIILIRLDNVWFFWLVLHNSRAEHSARLDSCGARMGAIYYFSNIYPMSVATHVSPTPTHPLLFAAPSFSPGDFPRHPPTPCAFRAREPVLPAEFWGGSSEGWGLEQLYDVPPNWHASSHHGCNGESAVMMSQLCDSLPLEGHRHVHTCRCAAVEHMRSATTSMSMVYEASVKQACMLTHIGPCVSGHEKVISGATPQTTLIF